jgi:RNA polymerase sigma-70 factor (ECF subfamily)
VREALVSLISGAIDRPTPAGEIVRVTGPHLARGGTTTDTEGVGSASSGGEVTTAVIAAAATGDREAFTAIIRTYEPRLRATAYHVLCDRELVDDALQDVFVAAFRALPGFRGDAALGTWLHRITYTTCAQYLRHASRQPKLVEIGLAKGDDATVADHTESVGDRDQLRKALTALTAEQRIVVLLVDRDGYDYRAAARLLGIPRGTVASRLNGARAQLRTALGLGQVPRKEGR